MSEFLYVEDTETFCCTIRRVVTLALQAQEEPATTTITGKPTECNHIGTLMMKKEDQPWIVCNQSARCLLKATKITTGRKK